MTGQKLYLTSAAELERVYRSLAEAKEEVHRRGEWNVSNCCLSKLTRLKIPKEAQSCCGEEKGRALGQFQGSKAVRRPRTW